MYTFDLHAYCERKRKRDRERWKSARRCASSFIPRYALPSLAAAACPPRLYVYMKAHVQCSGRFLLKEQETIKVLYKYFPTSRRGLYVTRSFLLLLFFLGRCVTGNKKKSDMLGRWCRYQSVCVKLYSVLLICTLHFEITFMAYLMNNCLICLEKFCYMIDMVFKCISLINLRS